MQDKSFNIYYHSTTLKEVSDQFGISIITLYNRTRALSINGVTRKKSAQKFYRIIDINRILSMEKRLFYKPETKIAIIELHLKGVYGFEIAQILNIDRHNVNRIIKSFKKESSLVLESKINYTIL